MDVNSLQQVAEAVERLKQQVDRLHRAAAHLELPAVEQTEWYQLMTQKLLPQLGDQSYLVVGVVGGTNIGKSVIFNHLCQSRISATSPLASGTKHPTCVVPAPLAETERLAGIFSEFRLQQSDQADDALQASEEDWLFWREHRQGPANLLLLDTPDIDSDAEVNWSRADKVRRAADVLIAVLTQQKYNDAAVKKFFRIAAQEDKTILVVFNQCLLPEDEAYWPIWLQTFCEQTGVRPSFVYLAPHDRRAAENNQLPFYLRDWPVPNTTGQAAAEAVESAADIAESRSLMQDLSELRFSEIKLRSLRGALSLLQDRDRGTPAYLAEIRRRAGVHGDAWQRLAERLQEISCTWPTVPNRQFIQEMRLWWKEQRTGWQASVHGFYDTLGQGILWPIQQLRHWSSPPPVSWSEQYREQEWETLRTQLTTLFDRLAALAEHGHPVLAPRLNRLLTGQSREVLLQQLQAAHQRCDFERELRTLVHQQMQLFREQRSDWFVLLKRLDTLSAAARPVVTVALFATGMGPVGQAVMPVVTDTAMQAALHVAGDVTAGTLTAAVGDTAIGSGASSGVRMLEAWLLQLHRLFIAGRKDWFEQQLQLLLWGSLLDDLQTAAGLPGQPEFRQVEQTLRQLAEMSWESPDTA